MDACNAVEEEVDKILLKFTGIKEHADRVLSDITNHVESLKKEMDECKHLSPSIRILRQTLPVMSRGG